MFKMQELFRKLQDQIYKVCPDTQSIIEAFYDLRNAFDKLPTNPTFKFALSQEVWFLKNDKVQKGNVRVRQITESSENLKNESNYFKRNTPEELSVIYSLKAQNTTHRDIDPNWQLEEYELFASKSELLESL